MGYTKLITLAALAVSIAPAFVLADPSIPITKIADTSTPDPSGSGDFTSFGLPSGDRDNSSVSGTYPNFFYYNNVFFTAQGPNGLAGVYGAVFPAPGISEIYTIADTTMTASTGGKFASFSNTSSGGNEVGFLATDSNGVQGVYEYGGDYYALELVASNNTSPAAGTTFGSFTNVSIMSTGPGGYVPEGEVDSSAGIYDFSPGSSPNSWTFTLLANTSTIAPGASTPFTSFGPVSYKASVTVSNILGYFSQAHAMLATVNNVVGVYATPSANFDLANVGGPLPGGGGTFTGFGNPVATATYIEFTASYSSASGPQQGIFVYGPDLNPQHDDPEVREFLSSGTVAPGSNGAHFASFQTLGNNETLGYGIDSAEDDNIPFLATLDDGVTGLFCTTGIGTSVKILDTGDWLDGKTVSSIEMSPDSSGTVFTVFEVGFTDGSSGIFYFDTNVLPEPAIGLLGLATLLIARRRGKLGDNHAHALL